MAARTWKVQQESAQRVLQFVQSFLSDLHPRDFSVELWDGTRWPAENSVFPRFTWKINNPESLKRAIFSANREVALAASTGSASPNRQESDRRNQIPHVAVISRRIGLLSPKIEARTLSLVVAQDRERLRSNIRLKQNKG